MSWVKYMGREGGLKYRVEVFWGRRRSRGVKFITVEKRVRGRE